MSQLKVKVRTITPQANTLVVSASGLKGNYIAGTGIGITGNSIAVTSGTVKSKSTEAHWNNDTLTNNESAKIHTNHGATGTITLILPASPATGTWFTFTVMEAYELRVDPGAASTYINGSIQTGKYIWANGWGETLTLTANSAGDWIDIGHNGTWLYE